VVFGKEYIMRCSSAELIARNGVPWDDAIVVSAGKLRKLWDSLSELCSSVCDRRLETTVLRPALLPVKTAQFTQFFPSGMMSHSKIAQFNWEYRALKAQAYDRWLACIAGFNLTGGIDVCLLWVLSGRGLCVRLITRPKYPGQCDVSNWMWSWKLNYEQGCCARGKCLS
jgi:hypothetical protein